MEQAEAEALVAAMNAAFSAPSDEYTRRYCEQVERYWAEVRPDEGWQVVLLWRQDERAYGMRVRELEDVVVGAPDWHAATPERAAYDIRDFSVVEPHGNHGTPDAEGRLWFPDDDD